MNHDHGFSYCLLTGDKDKYFIPILCYNMITVMGIIILVSIETIYITRIIHACGLFSIIRYVHN